MVREHLVLPPLEIASKQMSMHCREWISLENRIGNVMT